MNKFICQIAFEDCYQELLIKVQEHVKKFGDDLSPNSSCLQSMVFSFEGDSLLVKKPQTKLEEFGKDMLVLLLENVLQVPLFIDLNKGEKRDNVTDYLGHEVYQTYINEDVDPELHFLIYVSLTNNEIVSQIEKLIGLLPSNLRFITDVVALPNEISRMYQKERCDEDDLADMKHNLSALIDLKNDNKIKNIYFIQNINEANYPLHFTEERLAKLFGDFVLSLIEGYDTIGSLLKEDPITVFGIETLEIDKYAIINNWAFHILKDICNNVIHRSDTSENEEVDKEKVDRLFREILAAERESLDKLYMSKPNGQFDKNLDEWRDRLKERVIEMIVGEELNNGEKDLLLSYFQSLSKRDLLQLEDFNIKDYDLFDRIYIPYIEKTSGDDVYAGLKAVIIRIQELKKKIEKQNESIIRQRKLIDKAYRRDGKWIDGGYQIGDDVFKIQGFDEVHEDGDNHKEKDLFGNYQPNNKGVKPPTANLKSYFSQVKNQGSQGACASFSLVSVFEYFLTNEEHKYSDLSEAYVYYNARDISGDTNIDKGVNLGNVIKSMADSGVCLEELCKYDPKVFNQKPSNEAYEDGRTRKVTEAKQVAIDVDTIKSAILEGYPVVGCFRVFESLENNTSGYVPMPQKEEFNEKPGYHAMVICGYNDDHGHFIVRNSWGTGFGDNGYCYLPYSYIRDPELTLYAYAITGIEANAFIGHKPEPDDYEFDKKDENIKYAILLNMLKEEEFKRDEARKELRLLVDEFKNLIIKVKQKDDIEKYKKEIEEKCIEIENEIHSLESKKNDNSNRKHPLFNLTHLIWLIVSMGAIGYGIYVKQEYWWIPGCASLVLSILSWLVFGQKKRRKEKGEIGWQIEQKKREIQSLRKELEDRMQFRDNVLLLLDDVSNISDSAYIDRQLLNEIIQTLNDCYNQIMDYINQNRKQNEKDNIEYEEEYQKILLNVDKVNLLRNYFTKMRNLDFKEALWQIQRSLLNTLNNGFALEIDSLFDTDEWQAYCNRCNELNVNAQINAVKFSSNPDDNKLKQCSYFLTDLQNQIQFMNGTSQIPSKSKNRFIYLRIKKVTIDELRLFSDK